MKYNRFEDLPVWQAAIELKLRLDELLKRPKARPSKNWTDQIDRASLSISNNIAEGFERGSTNELLMFLYIARGSAGETRSMLQYLSHRPSMADLRSEISDLIGRCETISRQLRGWCDSLQNSEIKGQRHLTDESREDYLREKRQKEFWEKIRADHERRFNRPASEWYSPPRDSSPETTQEAGETPHTDGPKET